MKKYLLAFILSIFLLSNTNPVFAASFGNFSASSMDGDIVSQDIFKNSNLTMINIWGTFCGPCIDEIPVLGEISRDYKDKGLQVIGIVIDAVDSNGAAQPEQLLAAKNLLDSSQAYYLNIIPSPSLLNNQLRVVMAVPTTIFVNKEGEIVGPNVIGSKSKEGWMKIINAQL